MRLFRAYLRSFWALWKLRNSIAAADYDYRAYDSPIPLQRYWQRERYRITKDMIAGEGPVIDVGCGSSRIMELLPEGSVALDILIRKLRFDRRFGVTVVHGSGFESAVSRTRSFSCVLSSQVIEHVPKESPMIDELCRVLKPGGRLVVGTPDYFALGVGLPREGVRPGWPPAPTRTNTSPTTPMTSSSPSSRPKGWCTKAAGMSGGRS